ncbi:hypothetical protein [Roseibium litorale]|uniref:Uncharacterized protein n=1 Tax=Roseibium litorale TaxID=2803841 RepID=A0ABR9CH45_9HYPH|nr:hypothetical protein [Roseibium litorale]MBD8890175.1 hypothetical protein [Roseibium litorale]
MPVQLELNVTAGTPILRGPDHFWSVIKDLGKSGADFTSAEIRTRCSDTETQALGDYIRGLVSAGFLTVRKKAAGKYNVYRLVRKPLAAPAIKRSGALDEPVERQLNLWNAMRALDQFNLRELSVAASTDQVAVRGHMALDYCRRLERAGYLQVRMPGPETCRVWRLKPALNTGPLPPKILKTHVVYDQNRGQVIGKVLALEVPV